MACVGEVLFSMEKDGNDSELWDDTALIKAYDDAVRDAKQHVVNQFRSDMEVDANTLALITNSKGNPNVAQGKNKKQRSKKHKAKHEKKKAKTQAWSVGDHCRAVFTEDGQLYEAIIASIDEEMCTVRYLGYGNEEQQELRDLLKPASPSRRGSATPTARSHISDNAFDHSPGLPMDHGMNFPFPDREVPTELPSFTMPDLAGHVSMPPIYSSTQAKGKGPRPDCRIPEMLHVPPPPPLGEMSGQTSHEEQNALHSMLISWYMSGYHTGYYQALKEVGRKDHVHPKD